MAVAKKKSKEIPKKDFNYPSFIKGLTACKKNEAKKKGGKK